MALVHDAFWRNARGCVMEERRRREVEEGLYTPPPRASAKDGTTERDAVEMR
jgi:hypothetical protein